MSVRKVVECVKDDRAVKQDMINILFGVRCSPDQTMFRAPTCKLTEVFFFHSRVRLSSTDQPWPSSSTLVLEPPSGPFTAPSRLKSRKRRRSSVSSTTLETRLPRSSLSSASSSGSSTSATLPTPFTVVSSRVLSTTSRLLSPSLSLPFPRVSPPSLPRASRWAPRRWPSWAPSSGTCLRSRHWDAPM